MVHRPRVTPYFIFFIFAVIAVAGTCCLPLYEANALSGRNLIVRLLFPAIDAATLLMPYWLLPRKWRVTALLPIWLCVLWFTGSVWYFRFWGDFPDITALLFFDNLNSELFNSVVALWKPRDLAMPFFALLPTAYYFIKRKDIESYVPRPKLRIAAVAATFACYLVGQTGYSILMKRYYNNEQVGMNFWQATYMRLVNTNSVQSHSIRINGFVTHYVASVLYAYETLTVNRELTPAEIQKIEAFIAGSQFPAVLSDSLLRVNAGKNVILIVVESLNSSAISDSISPTLYSLLQSEESLSALNIETQTRFGGSGDGQLLANCGVHPLPRFSTSILLGSKNVFPALPRLLNRRENQVIFADSNESWNEAETFRNFGFERIICNRDYPDRLKRLGSDAAMFETADSLISTMREPYFLELLTVSMHIPFNDPNIPDSLIAQNITAPDGTVGPNEKYLRMLNYFDSALGRFLAKLNSENTLVFIVSDHSQNIQSDYTRAKERMAFIALNTGVSGKIDRSVDHVDVFSTILQLAGTGDSAFWKGAGTSILGPEQTSEHKAAAKKISELILRGDFFRGKICNE